MSLVRSANVRPTVSPEWRLTLPGVRSSFAAPVAGDWTSSVGGAGLLLGGKTIDARAAIESSLLTQ